MVKVLLKQFDPEDFTKLKEVVLYLDGYIKSNLDIGIKQLHNDFDQVWFVDGSEGSGKSDLMAQLAYYVNRADTRHTLIDRICVNADEFDKAILSALPFEAVVFDESFGALSSTGTMSKVNKVLQKRFTEIRSKNLFVFIGSPSFMDIMKYFAIWRSKCLLHVYLKNNKRGQCAFYGEKKKKKLYILGKKDFYNYSVVSPTFLFAFTKQMHKVIDKDAYDLKKRTIQTDSIEDERKNKIKDIKRTAIMKVMLNLMKKNPTIKNMELAELVGVSDATISVYRKQIAGNLLENEPLLA